MRIITVNKAERGLRWRCACGIHIGIPGGSLGAGGTTSSRDTLQRGGEEGVCFAYANELMASGGLAVTQQLWRGSPSRGSTEPRGLGSHGGT